MQQSSLNYPLFKSHFFSDALILKKMLRLNIPIGPILRGRSRIVSEEITPEKGLNSLDLLRNVLFCTATNPLVALGFISIIKEVKTT